MKQWNIGVLGASHIAYQRFLPALKQSGRVRFRGIAARDERRCEPFLSAFGGRSYENYEALLSDGDIDCVYVSLPPALHFTWGERVLRAGKHLMMEKPFTVSAAQTEALLDLAEEAGLAVHENYMFLYHRQYRTIREIMQSGALGELRMIRSAFTFPFRGASDFRYRKELGGGALLDCGGYPLLLANELLGPDARLMWAGLKESAAYGVDIGGSAVLQNGSGLTAHVFFGMDDTYRCELEVWGSAASLRAERIFTAPDTLAVQLHLTGAETKTIEVAPDAQFLNSIHRFADLMEQEPLRKLRREEIRRQSRLVDAVRHFPAAENERNR